MEKSAILFYDDYWLENKKGTKKRYFMPEYAGTYERVGIYQSIHWCSEIDKYRMWFEVLPDFANDVRRIIGLAESDDGINWYDASIEKDQFSDDIYKYGSIVYTGKGKVTDGLSLNKTFGGASSKPFGDPSVDGIHGTCVYRDPYERDPMKLYKMCTVENKKTYGFMSEFERNIVMLTSPDGVYWDERSRIVIYPFSSDTYNCLMYNPVIKEYFLYFRASGVDRRIALMRSKDFINWSRPIIVLHPDGEYNENDISIEYYSLWAGYINGLFLGHLWKYIRDTGNKNGRMETELVYSYNGINWFHTSRKNIVERPQPPNFGYTQFEMLGIVESRDGREWIMPASCSRAIHGSEEENANQFRKLEGKIMSFNFYKIRKGGFCGLECYNSDGLVSTKRLQLLKDDLSFNINVPFGSVRFAITDRQDTFYEGFAFDDCIPFSGDHVEIIPKWRERNLSDLIGKVIKIHIEINNGVIFSINGSFRPHIHGPQVSLNDGARVEVDEQFEGNNWRLI